MARRSYTAEFKREAVRLASKLGGSRRQAAKQLGIHPNVLAEVRGNSDRFADFSLQTDFDRAGLLSGEAAMSAPCSVKA